jgi:Fe2+-dicitrate sensor, membrane component
MGLKQETDLKVSEEAAMWLHRLQEQDRPQVRAEFSQWVRKGATHLEEFLFAQAIWKEMDHIDAGMRKRLWPADAADSVVAFPERENSRPEPKTRVKRPRWILSAAAGLAMLAIGCALFVFYFRSNVFVTAVGEQKSVKLADGSIMHLNTNSRAEVSMMDRERVIRLTAGEALFSVEHDARRAFYVLTDSARIRALGTQFNVYRNSSTETRVAVVDGVVQVSLIQRRGSAALPATQTPMPVQLKAGDEAEIARGHVVKTPASSIQRAVSWRTRRLEFPGNPVGEIADEFNRYNSRPIRIEGDGIKARRMSGIFDADDPSPLIRYLERDPKIEVVRGANEILIRPR